MVSIGLSTWSLHRSLEKKTLDLLDVPREMKARGFTDLQICHFQIPYRDFEYIARLKRAIGESGITLDAILMDAGDLVGEKASADEAEMRGWIDVAAELGAKYVRVAAGRQAPTATLLAQAARRLLSLSRYAAQKGAKLVTENWHELLPSSKEVLELMKLTEGKVPLCLDFGNWTGPEKYAELEAIAPDAVTVHAKCKFTATAWPDDKDFKKCLQILKESDYEGALALIYDGPSDDEWSHLEMEKKMARQVFPE
jgi:sugar phosphate isomerase/epimerase